MIYFLIALLIIVLISIKKIGSGERGVVYRFGRKSTSVRGPGFTIAIPFLERLERVSTEPFSVSLPPQSAITKDEIPIQLQASMDAVVRDPKLAALKVRDWRIHVMSQLQDLMKDRLEDLDFDKLDAVFNDWVQSIRSELNSRAAEIGVEVTTVQISNLSPRTRPQE